MKAVTFVFMVAFASAAVAQQRQFKQDARGAVLCSYAITSAMFAFQKQCHPESKAAATAFATVMQMHRDFVLRNTDWPDSHLRTFEKQQGRIEPSMCDMPDIRGMYEAFVADTTKLVEGAKELLSVDRKPVWNPCL